MLQITPTTQLSKIVSTKMVNRHNQIFGFLTLILDDKSVSQNGSYGG
jgi:hypothetical protein